MDHFFLSPSQFLSEQMSQRKIHNGRDISVHFLQAKHRGGYPLLDFSKAVPTNKATVSNQLTWSISCADWGVFDMLLCFRWRGSGLQIWEKTLIPTILWEHEGTGFYIVYRSKRSQEKRPGTKQHCQSLFLFRRQSTLVQNIENQLWM